MNKYAAVALNLRQQILDGRLAPGDKLLTIPQLCELFGVSKITVKKAMDELELQGFIARRRGSGTFVKGLPQGPSDGDYARFTSRLGGFTAEHAAHSQRTQAIVHEFEVLPTEEGVCRELRIERGSACYHIARTLLADGIAIQDQYLYIPVSVVPHLTREHVEASLYHYLENVLGLTVASAHRRVIATHATPEVAARLQIDTTDSILKIFQVTYLNDGRPCEKTVSYHAPGYEFFSIATR